MIEIHEILFDEQAIQTEVNELAARISTDYAGKDLVLVGILKGAVVFLADLIAPDHVARDNRLHFRIKLRYVNNISERNTDQKDIEIDVRGRHVLLVDTIIDTGETLDCLFKRFTEKEPASLEAVLLLDKKPRRTVLAPIKYRGFEIPDKFVVGYGVDCAEQYRNLPYVAAIIIT